MNAKLGKISVETPTLNMGTKTWHCPNPECESTKTTYEGNIRQQNQYKCETCKQKFEIKQEHEKIKQEEQRKEKERYLFCKKGCYKP